jgi:hypothetical protein
MVIVRPLFSRLAISTALVLALGAGAFALGRPALATPSPMTWADSGTRGVQTGTFTASEPLCSSGTWKDIEATIGVKTVQTCADGSGIFEFSVVGLTSWRFTGGGTRRYTTLRGSGTCHLVVNDDDSFVRTCNAIADFDNTAPSARIERLHVSRAGRADKMRVTFATADNVVGNAVSFRIEAVASGHRIGRKVGQTAGGTLRVVLTVRPPKRAQRVAISLRVADPLGNARTVGRSVSLPH